LADTRLRIKGRFVRRDSEEAKAYFANLKLDLVRSERAENTVGWWWVVFLTFFLLLLVMLYVLG
jgi:hypothetical protein